MNCNGLFILPKTWKIKCHWQKKKSVELSLYFVPVFPFIGQISINVQARKRNKTYLTSYIYPYINKVFICEVEEFEEEYDG